MPLCYAYIGSDLLNPPPRPTESLSINEFQSATPPPTIPISSKVKKFFGQNENFRISLPPDPKWVLGPQIFPPKQKFPKKYLQNIPCVRIVVQNSRRQLRKGRIKIKQRQLRLKSLDRRVNFLHFLFGRFFFLSGRLRLRRVFVGLRRRIQLVLRDHLRTIEPFHCRLIQLKNPNFCIGGGGGGILPLRPPPSNTVHAQYMDVDLKFREFLKVEFGRSPAGNLPEPPHPATSTTNVASNDTNIGCRIATIPRNCKSRRGLAAADNRPCDKPDKKSPIVHTWATSGLGGGDPDSRASLLSTA